MSRAWKVVWALAASRILLYLAIGGNYGYFRDELYFLACGEHPAWGYVDHPPLIGWIAWLLQHTTGTSVYALRLLPALAGAAAVVLTAKLAEELGARGSGIWLAGLAALVAPVYLAISHIFTMNAFDAPLWAVAVLILIRIIRTGRESLWLWFGAVCGFTLLNKYGIAFFLGALAVGMVATPLRRQLPRPWFWAGALACLCIALPNVWWQWTHGFPFLELMHNVRTSGKDIALPPLAFLGEQAMIMHPLSVILMIGAILFFFSRHGREFRVLGITWLVFTFLLMILRAKSYYVAPVYPVVFAAGAVAFESWTSSRVRWAPLVYGAMLLGTGAILAPTLIPVLPVPAYLRYVEILGLEQPRFENSPQGNLPQLFADMHGWPEMVALVGEYFQKLPPEEQARTAIFANNYGDAGAIDLFGARYGLPKAISGHQNYYFWGPRAYTGESLIVMNEHRPEKLKSQCASLTLVGTTRHPLARPDENAPIYHCRHLNWDLQGEWFRVKHWN